MGIIHLLVSWVYFQYKHVKEILNEFCVWCYCSVGKLLSHGRKERCEVLRTLLGKYVDEKDDKLYRKYNNISQYGL